MKTSHLPNTNDPEEPARFWQEHDLTDFEDELEEVTEPSMMPTATIVNVRFHEDTLIVDLADSREICAPLSWHPRLRVDC